ncbi:MAG: TOBE domain-containing protein [Hyphomicrobiales bacterium]|nr:TOBE domain-containing protein [Hyphomicrobiales bacterium]
MLPGKVLQVNTSERLYEIPSTRKAAEFIGSMNFFNGHVEAIENDTLLIDAGPLGRIRVIPGNEVSIRPGDAVSVGVRPEKLSIGDQPPGKDCNGVRGKLSTSAYFGDRNHFYIEIDGLERPVSVATQNDAHHAGAGVNNSSDVWLQWTVRGPVVLPHS